MKNAVDTTIDPRLEPDAGSVTNQAAWWQGWGLPALAGGLLLAGAVGVAAIMSFVEAERARDLRGWQDRLGLIADSRAADVAQWVAGQRRDIASLAGNASIQLLLTELTLVEGEITEVTDVDGQLQYLESLLTLTAQRGGFDSSTLVEDLRANVELPSPVGLAVLDTRGRPLVATSRFAVPQVEAASETPLLDLQADSDVGMLLTLTAPVSALQSGIADGPVGQIVARRPAAPALFERLRQPGLRVAGLEILLVRPKGASIEYLSPLADGTAALGRRLDRATVGLASADALSQPGAFLESEDYAGQAVLATGRLVAGTDWLLVAKVDSAVALADIDARANRLLLVLLLGLGFAAATILVVWRHGASRRASESARLYAAAAAELTRQKHLLQVVTDNQPTAIMILDDGQVRFANAQAAKRAEMAPGEMIGKSLSSVAGSAAAARTLALSERALEDGQPVSDVWRIEGDSSVDGGRRIYLADHVPVPSSVDLPRGVLVVERDVTAELRERARRESTLDALIATLVGVVDRRDPYAADHSHLVGELSQRLAREMDLEEAEVETARVAGLLMNIGKILVPEELLTREGALSEAERAQIRACMNSSAELLSSVAFDGPVVETLQQVQERVDGKGEKGLAGDEILPTARILTVANAFVAMVSARAHRAGLPVDEAMAQLLSDMGRRYDRGVVAALVSYLDNKGGRQHWETAAAQ